MERFYPPEGYTKDEASGLYYQWVTAQKSDGTTGNYIIWFNAETGTYTDPQEYIAPAAATTSNTATAAAEQNDDATPKKSKIGIIIVPILILLLLLLGFICTYYAQRLPSAMQDTLPDVMVDFLDDTLYDVLPSGFTGFLEDLAPEKSSTKDDEDAADDDTQDADAQENTDDETVAEPTAAPTAQPTAEPTPEPTETPVEEDPATGDATTYTGAAATAYLGGDDTGVVAMIGSIWQYLNYSYGTYSIDFNESNTCPYGAQAANGKVLKATVTADATIYEGISWASNDYNVTDYVDAQVYWYVCTVYNTNKADLSISLSHCFTPLSASYTVANEGSVSYSVNNVADTNPATAWSCDGNIGESITYSLDTIHRIYGVAILNGYWKSADLYTANGTAARLDTCYTDLESGAVISIPGSNLSPTVYNSYIGANSGYSDLFIFEEPITASEFTLIFSAITSGTKYDDLCVSEILLISDPNYVGY